jgi:hypothetical protein
MYNDEANLGEPDKQYNMFWWICITLLMSKVPQILSFTNDMSGKNDEWVIILLCDSIMTFCYQHKYFPWYFLLIRVVRIWFWWITYQQYCKNVLSLFWWTILIRIVGDSKIVLCIDILLLFIFLCLLSDFGKTWVSRRNIWDIFVTPG